MSPALLSKHLQTWCGRASSNGGRTETGSPTGSPSPAANSSRSSRRSASGGSGGSQELGDEDLDPHLLLWDVHRSIDTEAVPDGRTVIAFVFPEAPPTDRRWWIMITGEGVDVCDQDPGHPVRVSIESSLRTLTRVWRGDLTWAAAMTSGSTWCSAVRSRRAGRYRAG